MRHCRSAFTLVEMLLAIVLLAFLSLAVSSFIWDLRSRQELKRDAMSDHHAGTLLIESVESALSACIAGDESLGAGVKGDSSSLTVISRGVPLSMSAEPEALRDLLRTRIRYREDGSTLTISRSALALKSEAPQEALSDRVKRFRIRYHDGESWSDSFDSMQKGALPAAIEIAIWFRSPGQASEDATDEMTPSDFDSSGAPSELLPGEDEPGFDDIEGSMADSPVARPDRLRVIAIPDGGKSSEGVRL